MSIRNNHNVYLDKDIAAKIYIFNNYEHVDKLKLSINSELDTYIIFIKMKLRS